MQQPKVRRALSLLALTFSLALVPVPPAQASPAGAAPVTGFTALLAAEIDTLWETISAVLRDVGPRMDDNG